LFDITQPTLSHHLKKLVDAGVVVSNKQGRACCYTIHPETLKEVTQCLKTLTTAVPMPIASAEKHRPAVAPIANAKQRHLVPAPIAPAKNAGVATKNK
jgi:quinolinate synthase